MKGILLAGGNGTRLYPLTKILSKQLLPVYDKPMIYYPLSILMTFNIRDILIISTPRDTPNIENLFGDGSYLGLNIEYAIQEAPNGIAEAFIIAEKFIANEPVCLILGDNIFYINDQVESIKNTLESEIHNHATILSYHVNNPHRFGVVEFDQDFNVVSIEEKPLEPKSNFVSVGLYFYPGDVSSKAKTLKPSKRGELEITDLNNLYLNKERLKAIPLQRGNAWLDAGTPESLLDAASFVQIIEKRQGLKIACLEEIAYKKGFISKAQVHKLANSMANCSYKDYLLKVIDNEHNMY